MNAIPYVRQRSSRVGSRQAGLRSLRAGRWRAPAILSLAAMLAACASAGVGEGGDGLPRGRGSLAREDRVVVSRFADLTGVAVSQRYVFATSAGGLAIYDRIFDAWLPPLVSLPGAAGLLDRATAIAADPSSGGVWIGGSGGRVVYHQPESDITTPMLVNGGTVELIAFDRRNPSAGALVRASGQWSRASSTGFVMPLDAAQLPPRGELVLAPTLQQLQAEFPLLQAFAQLGTRDARLRSAPVSAAARSPDRAGEIWLATYGNGLFKVDPNFNQGTALPFGLLDRGVGALAPAADGVWAAGFGDGGRGGLTFADITLQRFRWLEPAAATAEIGGARAFALEVRGDVAWVGTSAGLVRLSTRDPRDARAWSAISGLPDDRVHAVLAREGGSWAGTARGLVFVRDTGRVRSARASAVGPVIAEGIAVRALAMTGDTLWVGSDAGLLAVRIGADGTPGAVVRVSQRLGEPRLARRVSAIAWSDSLLVVATESDLVRISLRSGRAALATDLPSIGAIGPLRAIALDGRALWVAGPLGVVAMSRAGGASRFLPTGVEMPGEPWALLLGRDVAWIGARDGLVRLRLTSDGLPR